MYFLVFWDFNYASVRQLGGWHPKHRHKSGSHLGASLAYFRHCGLHCLKQISHEKSGWSRCQEFALHTRVSKVQQPEGHVDESGQIVPTDHRVEGGGVMAEGWKGCRVQEDEFI